MAIKCCEHCEPPKRNPYCHASCPDYIVEKAFEDADRAIQLENKLRRRGITDQRGDYVRKTTKRKGRKFVDNSRY